MATHETLGLILVREGVISRPQLYDALRLQRSTGQLLGTCLIELGYLEPESLLHFLSRQLGAPICRSEDLSRADPTAVARLSPESARSLLAFPIGWEHTTLQLAIASGAVLSQLQSLALETRCAVRPWVALERDILSAIERSHGSAPTPPPGEGLLPRQRRGTWARPPDALEPPKVLRGAPPPAPVTQRLGKPPSTPPLERAGLYDAVEHLYEANSSALIGLWVGRALLNYFSRVLVLEAGQVIGHAGVMPQFSEVEPATRELLGELEPPALHYGPLEEIRRAETLASDLRIGRAPYAMIARSGSALSHYADNGEQDEPYDDLHDLEMLFKEAATALRLLSR